MSLNCNLKIYNALWRIFRARKRVRPLRGLKNRETWGTWFGKSELLL